MEKTFKLEPKELAAHNQLEQERTQTLAQIGGLSLDLEAAKQRLNSALEHQRSFIRSALIHRGVDQFQAAQIMNGSVICSIPDEPMAAPAEVIEGRHVNGAPALEH